MLAPPFWSIDGGLTYFKTSWRFEGIFPPCLRFSLSTV